MDVFLQQIVVGLTIGSLYALIAVGYTVVYGIVQLINFAHGEVFMIGAFGALATWTVLFKGETAIWILPIMIVGAALCSVGVALLMERVAYRPLRHAPRLAPLITAIGISVLLQEAVRLFYGRVPGFPDAKSSLSFPGIDIVTGQPFSVSGINVGRPTLFIIGCLIVCSVALWLFINRTKQGRAMLAVSQDPDTARLMGVNVDRTIAIAFAIGAVLAAIAGVAQGLQTRTIAFNMGFMSGLKAFTAAVLGGIGNIQGAVAGGLVLGLIEAQATQFLGGATWANVWAFILLIIVLVFRPQGLLGAKVVDRA
ncbi:MAG TPA: branched-chain amino acid ABC transporter permease [Phycicoccus elongatus]|jgi:branched-chain amino acid transport system permease protein|uniref:branched-chain amino acid ABC transporter permease n=1 Tax=Phycicoccus TaxID=367298 RepID=UPI001DF4BC4E|nr:MULTISPECIES: branched-chain amino acid ABC transporter permease [Phycicoccus]MBK8727937.1 branched-chain amino acid ABC transporter permease [Tetrasphaera sp.]MCA0322066.1 branched-chain amino acid ABC transporter permease [Actinomycetota bacterium]MCB1239032.1 branched-chain amino acid ABC transporter permease [Tetrasphaera sp.]MCB9405447.1 branched-chain amino acid ABC transporter permease [Tetrasphaera sp.]HPF75710.1 branched-chain amino acid ABC transporter permease [Phycicoccus elonga